MATVAVGGVTVGPHTLSKQAERLSSLTNRVLRRLHRELVTVPDGLPSPAWLEAFRYIAPTILALLREQRDRAMLATSSGAPALTDEEYESGMAELKLEVLRELPTAELEALLKQRVIDATRDRGGEVS